MQQIGIDAEEGRRPDRRNELRLRETFDRAYETLSPFMDPKNSWGGQFTGGLRIVQFATGSRNSRPKQRAYSSRLA